MATQTQMRMREQARHLDRIEQADAVMRDLRRVVGADVEMAQTLLDIACHGQRNDEQDPDPEMGCETYGGSKDGN